MAHLAKIDDFPTPVTEFLFADLEVDSRLQALLLADNLNLAASLAWLALDTPTLVTLG